jgi:excisionase family DNA binding protein
MAKIATTKQPYLVDQREWLTAAEAAQLIGYNEEYVRQLARAGTIQSRKVSRSLLIHRASLLEHKKRMDSLGTRRFSKVRRARVRKETNSAGTAQDGNTVPALFASPQADTIPSLNISAEERRARNEAAVRTIQGWLDATGEEAEDQRDTLAFLVRAMDEDRPSSRKRFPDAKQILRDLEAAK